MLGRPIQALFYDGRQSRAVPVTVSLTGAAGTALALVTGADGSQQQLPLDSLRIDERVGDAPRFLHLPQGGSLEILDNDAFDEAMRAAGLQTLEGRVRGLEARWAYAVLALVAIVAATWAFLTYGVPALALRATALIPPSVDAHIGAEGLELLDRTFFEESALPAARQRQLRRLFDEIAAGSAPDSARYRLELRAGGAIGANALALPSGIVILTDELESAARHDDELRAVFAHEVGHLARRHAMRRLVQSSATALLVMGLFGDVSSITSLAAAVPAVLVDAAYSRDLEREADAFAYQWMAKHGVAPRRLGDLLSRLTEMHGGEAVEYLSSHPKLAERIRH